MNNGEKYFNMKTPNNDKIMKALRLPISGNKPISAQFINFPKPEKMLIKPVRKVESFDEEGKEKIELWLSFCAIGTQILDTGTKMLSHLNVIHRRDAVFDLIKAFKQLRSHFVGNENFDAKETDLNDFLFTFLTMTEEQQNRVMKFQESILK